MRVLLFLKNECRQSFKILCSLAFILALALAIATAIGQTERMIKSSSAKAAEQFDILVGAKGSRTSLLLSTVYLRDEMVSLTPASALTLLNGYKGVKWSAPLAFGDRVDDSPLVGTTRSFITWEKADNLSKGVYLRRGMKPWRGCIAVWKSVRRFSLTMGELPVLVTNTIAVLK